MNIVHCNMSSLSLMDDYVQQYGVLVAEITSNTAALKIISTGGSRMTAIRQVQEDIEEGRELLEAMMLEAQTGSGKPLSQAYLDSYKMEFGRLEEEFQSEVAQGNTARKSLLNCVDSEYVSSSIECDQTEHLLENTETVERSGRKLTDGYKVCTETEKIGTGILSELNLQREVIKKARAQLNQTEDDLFHSSRTANSMMLRNSHHKAIASGIGIIVVGLALCGLYYVVTK